MTLADRNRARDALAPLLLTLASGALLAFSLPPYNVEWLGWFALAPVLVATRGRRPLEAMGLGLLVGTPVELVRFAPLGVKGEWPVDRLVMVV